MSRLHVLLGILLVGGATAAQAPVTVEIAPQPLSSALNEFAEKTGLQLAYRPHVTDDIDSPGTDGAVPPDVALQQLLEGSGLEYEFINSETVVIQLRPSSPQPVAPGEGDVPPDAGEPSVRPGDRPRARDRPVVEEVVVTGSRIERSGRLTPTPTTVVSGDTLRLSGRARVADWLVDLPAIGATHTAANSNDDPAESGAGLLDLRRLGIERTLVLVNGRRHVGSRPGTSAIDVNTIPAGLVDRVEIITGGASAVYGADAVSGVVNIILKRDIDGVSLNLQGGQSSAGDGESLAASLTAGVQGKYGAAWFDLSVDDAGAIDALDREHARDGLRYAPAIGAQPARLLANTRFNGTPPGGLPLLDAAGTPLPGGPYTFDDRGSLRNYDTGEVVAGAPFLSVGGGGIYLAPFDRLQVPLERQILSAGFEYAVSDTLTVFGDGKHARVMSSTAGQPSFSLASFVPLQIQADNAFIRPDLAAVLAGDPADPSDDIESFFLARTHVDLGQRLSQSERDTSQWLVGLRGQWRDRWQYELAWQQGRTTNVTELLNSQLDARLRQAVDAVFDGNGNVVCRDPSGGCMPVNLLGEGLLSDAGRDWVLTDIVTRGTLQQTLLGATITGQLVTLPAGPLGFAAGIEYREESSRTREGELRNEGRVFPGGRIEDVAGRFDVTELFAEVMLPLVAGRRGIEASSVEAAARVADYSTIGQTTSWRLGGDWMPVEGLRLRGVLARAVRAPNIGELFSPERLRNLFLEDPCDQSKLDDGSVYRRDNCSALGLPPDFQSTAGSITTRVLSGGNAALREEDARTVTFGAVISPPGSGFSATVDWWDIEISDAVNEFPVQAVIDNCVDLSTIDNPFCPSVGRDANGQFVSVDSSLINVAAQRASGLDLEFRYALPMAGLGNDLPGTLQFAAVATWLERLEFEPLPDRPDIDREAGELGDPRVAANLRLAWQGMQAMVSLSGRYLGDQRFDRAEPKGQRVPDSTGSTVYTDMAVRYRWRDGLEIYAGINNLSDEPPPPIARIPELRSFGEDVALYDVAGRYLYAGITATLQ